MKGIPQLVIIAMGIVALCISAYRHGKPKTGEHNFWTDFLVIIVEFAFLYSIGFFK